MIHIEDPEQAAGFYDNCINDSPNGLIYALGWYMNIVCPDWEILASKDNSTVMPLPVHKSLGRKLIRQPDYAWKLGVFSTGIPSPQLISQFLDAIPGSYRMRKLCMSKFNILPSSRARFLNSTELDLIQPYRSLRTHYGPSVRKALEKSAEESLTYINNISVHEMLMFAYRLDKFNRQRPKPKDISLLRLIASNAIRFRKGHIGAAYDRHNSLCATVFFLVYNGRAIVLYAAASNEGMNSGGIEFILDRFIRDHAEENLVLCTDNPSDSQLMDILKSYGSVLSNYPCLRKL